MESESVSIDLEGQLQLPYISMYNALANNTHEAGPSGPQAEGSAGHGTQGFLVWHRDCPVRKHSLSKQCPYRDAHAAL